MERVYLAFLGNSDYKKVTYGLDGKVARPTRYVQAAELDLLGPGTFDKVHIVLTRESKEKHWAALRDELITLGVPSERIEPIDIDGSRLDAASQWRWFERILQRIGIHDHLTVDLTHGYRIIPIVFSTAINFLQQARNITLEGVYYGAFDAPGDLKPIEDMRDFYLINAWADGVGRLVDQADASRLADVAGMAPDIHTGVLGDQEVVKHLHDLTACLKNVDIDNVEAIANTALADLKQRREGATEVGRLLIDLVIDKFSLLVTDAAWSKRYDRQYFELQLTISRVLLEHELYMQGYTVMRELVASLGVVWRDDLTVGTSKARAKRKQYGEVFVVMLQVKEEEWRFPQDRMAAVEKIRPFYEDLKEKGVEPVLRELVQKLVSYRNGFDHAWTAVAGSYEKIDETGRDLLRQLKHVVDVLFAE